MSRKIAHFFLDFRKRVHGLLRYWHDLKRIQPPGMVLDEHSPNAGAIMSKFSKYALLCAVLPLGLIASGCTAGRDAPGIGLNGVNEVASGDWNAARASFNADYATYGEHPIAVFNKGVTIHHDGDVDKADTFFSEAVVRGQGYHPDLTLEPERAAAPAYPMEASLTVKEHACNRLHSDNKLDVNCGDQIVAIVTPPPAPAPEPVAEVAPPAPPVEAEATVAPAPKPSRH
jgi:hypothetical protein